MNTKIIELSAKYLAGEMDEKEIIVFRNLINSNTQYKRLFEQCQTDWLKMESYKNKKTIDVNKAWNNLKNRFESENLIPEKQTVGKKMPMKFLYQIAAAFIIGIFTTLAILIINREDNQKMIEITVNNHEMKMIQLSDGSVITLNENSYLKYPSEFNNNFRSIVIQGKAFCEITPNKNKPFIINTNDADVKVLGTTFTIDTKKPENKIEVVVKTGTVQVFTKDKQSENIILIAGEKGILTNNKLLKSINADKNYFSWKTKIINFNGENLHTVIQTINEVYLSDVRLGDASIEKFQISETTFNNLSLDMIIDLLCATFNLKFEKKGNEVILLKNDK